MFESFSRRASSERAQFVLPILRPGIRNEIVRAIWDDVRGSDDTRRLSSRLGDESKFIDVNTAAGEAVAYFASGPAIGKLVYNFPLATEYHLIDSLLGWGECPRDLIDEITGRLTVLSGGAQVRVNQSGILDQLSSHSFDDRKIFAAEVAGLGEPILPIEWSVEWESPTAGSMTKRVFLHVEDLSDHKVVQEVCRAVSARKKLEGLLIDVVSIQDVESLPQVFESIAKNSANGCHVVADTGQLGEDKARSLVLLSLGFDIVGVSLEENGQAIGGSSFDVVRLLPPSLRGGVSGEAVNRHLVYRKKG